MAGESEIDDWAFIATGCLGEGSDESLIVLDAVDVPDDVVASEDATE